MSSLARASKPPADPFEGDDVLAALVFAALDHATLTMEEPDDGPVAPFAITVSNGTHDFTPFQSDDYQRDVLEALTFAHAGDFDSWAVAWDGYLTVGDISSEAVFVKAGRWGARPVLFAWRYDRPKPSLLLRRIGHPVFLGHDT